MEYTIYNESLVHYALKDINTSKYLKHVGTLSVEPSRFSWLEEAELFPSKSVAEEVRKKYSDQYELEIRQVKVIDIGKTVY